MFKICKKTTLIDGNKKTVYGIQSREITVDDITTDIKSIKRLIKMLNKNKVSSYHILNIIEDFIITP